MPDAVEQKPITITKKYLERGEQFTLTVKELSIMANRLGIALPPTTRSVLQFIDDCDNKKELILIHRLAQRKLKDMGITPQRKTQG